jgi:hypothetical protein
MNSIQPSHRPSKPTRYLVDRERLIAVTSAFGGSLINPLKSGVVHERRSMGTGVMRKDDER